MGYVCIERWRNVVLMLLAEALMLKRKFYLKIVFFYINTLLGGFKRYRWMLSFGN
jgi:hypothetical protein